MNKELREEYNEEDYETKIYLDDELIFAWSDWANQDCPEDLIWHRMIQRVFYAGVEAGKRLANEG